MFIFVLLKNVFYTKITKMLHFKHSTIYFCIGWVLVDVFLATYIHYLFSIFVIAVSVLCC